jgi:hypothetical protein
MVRLRRMEFRRLLSTKNIILLLVLLALLVFSFGYFMTRKPPRLAMTRYIPANALAYIEVNSLTEVMDGLTGTRAWNEISPVLGLSNQLKQLGSGIELMSSTGLGPDEVVIAGRAQYAVAVTGIEAGTGTNDEGVYLNVKPRFALLVETHADAGKAAKLATGRASIIAHRIFGEATREESSTYEGTSLVIFHGAEPERQLVAASSGSLVLIANHQSAIKACLDAIAGKSPTLFEDQTLNQGRGEVDHNGAIFAYVTQNGIEQLAQFGPAIFAARFTNNPDTLTAVANLFGHISKQTAEGVFYSLEFTDEEVVERYLTVLRPQVASGLKEATKAPAGTNFRFLELVPPETEECTTLTIEAVGGLPEKLLKNLSPGVDLVAGVALREFVINFRKNLGVESTPGLSDAIGNEIVLVKMNQSEPVVMVIQVRDSAQLLPAMNHYLSKDNAKISSALHNGVEVKISSHEDGRAAAFVGEYMVLGTANQLRRIIDTKASQVSAGNDSRIQQIYAQRPQNSSILSYETNEKKVGEMMLAISKLTRVTDGSTELLEREPMKKALARLPLSTSYTSFRDSGVFTQTRSAVGIFRHISDWLE